MGVPRKFTFEYLRQTTGLGELRSIGDNNRSQLALAHVTASKRDGMWVTYFILTHVKVPAPPGVP